MKNNKNIIFIIMMLVIIILIIICLMKKERVIYYNYIYANTSHATPIMNEYKIYSSGKIEKYSHNELMIMSKIKVDELKKLEDLISLIENNFKNKESNEEKRFQMNGTYIYEKNIYGKSNNEISLYDIEAEKLEEILTYTEGLEKKYCDGK